MAIFRATPPQPENPGPPWRGLTVLTLVVVAAHALLVMLLPPGVTPRPSSLVNSFTTRTIEIAPAMTPASPTPASASDVAAPSSPGKKPAVPIAKEPSQAKPARPRVPARPPRSTPTPPPPIGPAPAQSEATPDTALQTEPSTEASAPPAPTLNVEATGSPESLTSPVAANSTQPSTGRGDGTASGAQEGPVPIKVPGSVRLAFAVTAQQGASPMQGVFGDLVWLQDGQQYDARLSLTFLFKTLRTQHSNGAIGPTGIEPLRFSEKRKTEIASHFVRDQNTVLFSSNAPPVPLLPGAQDRLSVVMQLGALLAGDSARYVPGGVIAVQTVGTRDGEIWTFRIGEDERVSVPAGEYLARKLTRSPRKPFDDTVELWIAPELGHLPVRIKQTQSDGDYVDFLLREVLPVERR